MSQLDCACVQPISINLVKRQTIDARFHELTSYVRNQPFRSKQKPNILCGQREIISTASQRLKLDAQTYRIPVAFKTAVVAGRNARLLLTIDAEKSSIHDFSVVVQLSDGREITSRPISLLYYKPSWIQNENPQLLDTPANEYENYDIVAGDLKRFSNMTAYDCQQACEKEQNCKAYSYDKWNSVCSLKSSAGMLRLDAKYSSEVKVGQSLPNKSTEETVLERYQGKSFTASSYAIRMRSNFQECEQLCQADKACVAFSFKTKVLDCHLFNIVNEPEKEDAVESGVKRQMPH